MKKIVVLAGKGKLSQFVYNGLKDLYPIEKVIFEENEEYKSVLKRRAKRIGRIKTLGQYLFTTYTFKKLAKTSSGRIKEILQQNKLNPSKIPDDKKLFVSSVNDPSTIDLLKHLQPDIVIVNGTRILKKEVLQSTPAIFINIHSGITPEYRGYAGAYWSLVQKAYDKCGSTIHLINEGIDTGSILYQQQINVTREDNYVTYLFLQLAVEIEMLKKVLGDIHSNNSNPKPVPSHGKLFYEPTIWSYWYNRWIRKVK